MKRLPVLLLSTLAGCSGGGSGGSGDGRADDLLVGGAVSYCPLEPDLPLSGVSVTLTDFEGDTRTATTGSGGLWEEGDVPEGVYQIAYDLAGYESLEYTLLVSQPEGSPVELIPAGDICLAETLSTASVAPFGVSITSYSAAQGPGGVPLEYSRASDGDIVLTFDRPIVNFLEIPNAFGGGGTSTPFLTDPYNGGTLYPTADQTFTVFTFHEADLDAFNGAGINTEGTLTFIYMDSLMQVDPINGGQSFFYGTLSFRGRP